MTRHRAALWVAAALAAAACGKSKEEEAFEEVERQCNAATSQGLTLAQIDQGLARNANWGVFVPDQPCSSTIGSISSSPAQNQCTPPEQDPQCPVYFLWLPADPDLREPTGSCLACEVRQNASEITGEGVDRGDVAVCGSRFRRGVCCPGAEC